MYCLVKDMLLSVILIYFILITKAEHAGNIPDLAEKTDLDQGKSKTLLLKKRKLIANEFLKSFEKEENWIDPYDMLGNTRLAPGWDSVDKFVQPDDTQMNDALDPQVSSYIVDHQVEHPGKLSSEMSSSLDIHEEPLPGDLSGKQKTPDSTKLNDLTNSNSELGDTINRQDDSNTQSIYISRWLKKFLLKINNFNAVGSRSITILITTELLEELKDISTAKSLKVSKLDDLIFKIIENSDVSSNDDYNWYIVYSMVTSNHVNTAIIFSLVVFLYMWYKFMNTKPYLAIFVTFCLVNIGWHWMYLYQQKLSHKHAELHMMNVPAECLKNEFGLFNSLYYYLKGWVSSGDQCKKYYEALMVDPIWEVSLSMAMSEAVTAVIFQPLNFATKITNSSFKQLFDGLPIIPTAFLILLFILILIMQFNYRIRLPFFLGAIEPHVPPAGAAVQDIPLPRLLSQKTIRKSVQSLASTITAENVPHSGNCLVNDASTPSSTEENAKCNSVKTVKDNLSLRACGDESSSSDSSEKSIELIDMPVPELTEPGVLCYNSANDSKSNCKDCGVFSNNHADNDKKKI